jgi:hypothetical protein
MLFRLFFVAFTLLLAGCRPGLAGSMSPDGFKHGEHDYEVRAADKEGNLLSSDWRLDNIYVQKSGGMTVTEPKRSAEYMTTLHFDTDGDGEPDLESKALVYDLRYVHKKHSGVIWLRTVPISQNLREKELRVLMQDYLDAVAGAGYEIVSLGTGPVVVEKRYGVEILDRQAGTLAFRDAFSAEFAVANIDQLQVEKDARETQVLVLLCRPGFVHTVGHSVRYPVLMVAGLASQPEDFDKALPDFMDFLSRIQIGRASGLKMASKHKSESQKWTGGKSKPKVTAVKKKTAEEELGSEGEADPEEEKGPETTEEDDREDGDVTATDKESSEETQDGSGGRPATAP